MHEETVHSYVTVWVSEFEGWGRGINIPMISQPLLIGVRAMEANSRLLRVFVTERKGLRMELA